VIVSAPELNDSAILAFNTALCGLLSHRNDTMPAEVELKKLPLRAFGCVEIGG
jgi:hypothetical protein